MGVIVYLYSLLTFLSRNLPPEVNSHNQEVHSILSNSAFYNS